MFQLSKKHLRYSKYKPTNIDWIGDIPEGWGVRKMSHTLESCYAPIKTWPFGSDLKNEDIFETGSYRIYNQRNVLDKNFEEPANYISEQKFNDLKSCEIFPWDVLITSRWTIWKTCLFSEWKTRWILHPCLIRIRISKNHCLPKYLQLILENGKYIQEQFVFLSNATTIEVIYGWTLSWIRLIMPTLEEQEQIVDYLNKKTALLDESMAKKRKQIGLLSEHRTALINNAITKGLDPKVEMKYSGVEWIGMIPKEWKMRKVARSFNLIGSGTTPSSANEGYYESGTINWVMTGDLNDGILNESSKKITEEAFLASSALKIFPKNTLLIAMYGATIWKVAILNIEATTNQACCALWDSNFFDTKYVYYWFLWSKEHIVRLGYWGGQPNISQSTIKNLYIQSPELEEQKQILDYLDKETEYIDSMKAKIERSIELLEEYKTSLISHTVSGKIMVS